MAFERIYERESIGGSKLQLARRQDGKLFTRLVGGVRLFGWKESKETSFEGFRDTGLIARLPK